MQFARCGDIDMLASNEKLFLDSGAFSAWTQQGAINLEEYIGYIKKNSHLLRAYFNLDVLPGVRGQKRSSEIIEVAARQSYTNLKKMKRAGLTPIPVFHQGDRMYWLERMLIDAEPYIALATEKNKDWDGNVDWLDRVFSLLVDAEGLPRMKVHGLGIAGYRMLRRYPWTTCDASSWAMSAAYGSVNIPPNRGDSPDYLADPLRVGITDTDRKSGRTTPGHYRSYGTITQSYIQSFLENEVGVTVQQCVEDYYRRAQVNVFTMVKFQQALGQVRFRPEVLV